MQLLRSVQFGKWLAGTCTPRLHRHWLDAKPTLHLGARGRTATQRSKKGSGKVLERVLEKGSQKGSQKGVCLGFTVKKGSEKGSQKGF